MLNSALEPITAKAHFDGNNLEWVVRVINKDLGSETSLCGCPGEYEARLICSLVSALLSVCDVTFAIREGGNKPAKVVIENMVQFDEMKRECEAAGKALLDFTK